MRLDKLTTKLQEALADAQSHAVGNDNQYIEPVHVLVALLSQDDSSTRSLLQRAGANINGMTSALRSALDRLPKVSGNTAGNRADQVQRGMRQCPHIVATLQQEHGFRREGGESGEAAQEAGNGK